MELVQMENGQVYATSLMVATAFGKQHKDVIRKIEILIADMTVLEVEINERKITPVDRLQENQSEYIELKFEPVKTEVNKYFMASSYTDLKGELRKMYKMTKNGFALLVMGFTGLRALEWKLRYIEAYDNMEKQINQVRDICISDTRELELIRGSARSIVYIEEKLRSDMKEMENIIRRIGDRNANLYSYGTVILDMSKNIEQGKLRGKNEY